MTRLNRSKTGRPRFKTVPAIDGSGWAVINAVDLTVWAGPYKTRAEALFHKEAMQNSLKGK
jgi:hypothetical protein